ncbi:MAG TPA: hypothetical protein VGO57_02225 [Verrucomicrobiae bacterium]|jgi:hypothetical protein
MNSQEKELFRLALLRVLDSNRTRYGLGVVAIAHALRLFSFTAANFSGDAKQFHDAIADEIQYLTDKGLIEEAMKAISPENRAWRIASEGIALVDKNP